MARIEEGEGAARERLLLTLHGVGPVPPTVEPDEAFYWCSNDQFLEILDAAVHVRDQLGLPVEITFDDGNSTDALVALPALLERGLHGRFFVCTARIGQPGYLSADQIRQLRFAGMSVGSHGHAHIDWCDADDPTLEHELRVSLATLSAIVGEPLDEAALPFGVYNRRVLRFARQCGVRTLYTSDGGRDRGGRWVVRRQTCDSTWTRADVIRVATAKVTMVMRLRRLANRIVNYVP